jgi:hypothetical protein
MMTVNLDWLEGAEEKLLKSWADGIRERKEAEAREARAKAELAKAERARQEAMDAEERMAERQRKITADTLKAMLSSQQSAIDRVWQENKDRWADEDAARDAARTCHRGPEDSDWGWRR